MNEQGKSTLLNKTGKLVGFGYDKHPTRPNWNVCYVFYWIKPDEWVLCLGEFKGKPRPEELRPTLGEDIPGREFAPYATRGLQGMNYATFKTVLNESYPHVTFEWWEEK